MLLLDDRLTGLYTVDALSEGYAPDDVETIVKTFSFRQYQKFRPFKEKGRIGDEEVLISISKHDAQITKYLLEYLYDSNSEQLKKVVGVMGGHSEARSSKQYQDIANLCRFLTLKGFLIVTGGGPGIMEAAHLGAYFCNMPDDQWKSLLDEFTAIKGQPYDKIPKGTLVDKAGNLSPEGKKDYKDFHAWYKFADDFRRAWSGSVGESLAISTWEYGQEPVMPFASAYACYFQNSIRESALVREARAGIVYARGGGGTLREIWQDIEENYYCEDRESLTPMIFFDHESIWGDISSQGTKPLDIYCTVLQVLNYRLGAKGFSWEDKITSTTNYDKIHYLLERHSGKVREEFVASFVASNKALLDD